MLCLVLNKSYTKLLPTVIRTITDCFRLCIHGYALDPTPPHLWDNIVGCTISCFEYSLFFF